MTCAHCQGVETFFSEKLAAKELKRYRKKGAPKTTRVLIEAIREEGIAGLTLLDIGGGVGVIQHELLDAGIAGATNVDASAAYIRTAKEESDRLGHTDRVDYHHGDFVELASGISEADVVTLDRVICCYPSVDELVGLSASLARKLYALTYPRKAPWIKLGFSLMNLVLRLRRNPLRVYVHPPQAVDATVREKGLQERFHRNAGLIWQVAVYVRTG